MMRERHPCFDVSSQATGKTPFIRRISTLLPTLNTAMPVTMPCRRLFLLSSLSLLLTHCGDEPKKEAGVPYPAAKPAAPAGEPAAASTPTAATPAKPDLKNLRWTPEMMHTEIKYHNQAYTGDGQFNIEDGKVVALSLRGAKIDNLKFLQHIDPLALDVSETPVSDLRPMQGKKLVELYLEDTKAQDLSPLRGIPLQKLYLSRTPVQNLAALEGMPLTELNAVDCPIGDISGIARCPIQMLWLTGCPVESIAALKTVPLVSVTLHRTKVKDLTPLSGTALQRLHIAETPVTDLSPLKGMQLTRLVFTPANITAGIEIAKTLPLQEIGTRFDDQGKDLQPPATFWPAYDAAATAPPRP